MEFFKWAASTYGLSWGLFLGAVCVIFYLGKTWLPKELYLYERDTNGKALECLTASSKELASSVQSNHEALARLESRGVSQ